MGSDAKAALEDLRMALADSDERVRAETYAALANHAAIKSEDLIAAIKEDAHPLVRRTSLTLLARDHDGRVELLAFAMRDVDAQVRSTAGALLQKSKAEDVVSVFSPMLDSPDKETVRFAARVLTAIGVPTQAGIDLLLARLDDPDFTSAHLRCGVCVISVLRQSCGRQNCLRPYTLTATKPDL